MLLPFSLLLTTLLTLDLFLLTNGYTCLQSTTPLPPFRDCRIIIAGLEWVSAQPLERNPRDWGRAIPSTKTTEPLPRYFMIQGRKPPNECAVQLDVDPIDYYAVDTFSLAAVAQAARVVYWGCLVGKGMVGLEYPNLNQKRVWAKLIRLDWVNLREVVGERRRVLGGVGGGNLSMVVLDGRGGGVGVERKDGDA